MKNILFCFILLSTSWIHSNGNYLWQYTGNGQVSCCLHLNNVDICNPNAMCTRNLHADLSGIYDYISRILQTENISKFPYAKFLNEAQAYIRKMSGFGSRLSYHTHEYRSDIKFFHELVLENVKPEKSKPTATTDAEKTKAKQNEVFDYLVKIGLAFKTKK